jgi:Zn-dependent peptidase ImmA (M78 family)
LVCSRIEEEIETVVLQLSFDDWAYFCLSNAESYDVIVVNTFQQTYPRRLFTLAHELYHCVLAESGLSDPYVERNSIEAQCNKFAAEFLAPRHLVETIASRLFDKGSDFEIDGLRRFASTLKISLYSSLLRLIETGFYKNIARAAWNTFAAQYGNPDFTAERSGGRRVEEWKYKLARYGFLLPKLLGSALSAETTDPVRVLRTTGIKPKYQREYFTRAFSAAPEDAEDE